MQKIIVTRREAGWRFDKYLKKVLPQASSGFLYKMLRKKNITLNEKKAAGNEVVSAGDSVELFFSEETFRKFSGELSVPGADGEMPAARGEMRGSGRAIRQSADGEVPAICGELRGKEHALPGGKQPENGHAVSRERSGRNGIGRAPRAERNRTYREAYRKLGDIPVIYEDEDILILDKPAGVLSQKAGKEDISLNEWMLGYLSEKGEFTDGEAGYFKPSVCNRLDRNTSGLVLCGKSVKGSQFLAKMLRDRSLHKYYEAYAAGRIKEEIFLKGYLRKEEAKNRSEILSEEEYRRRVSKDSDIQKEYKQIETVIKPLFYDVEKDCTKLEILLVTGKSHQIRAHLASIGHPVLGDWKYGWKPRGKKEEQLKHQILHAGRIEFPKIEGEFARLSEKHFEAACPEDFSKYGEET